MEGKLFAALAAAQGEFPAVPMSGTNPHYKSRYSTLADITSAVRPVLSRHGLAIVQLVEDGGEYVKLRTILAHASGEQVEAIASLKPERTGPHGYGSALSYLRRYALSSALGIVADEDDDGNAAMPTQSKASPAPKQEQPKQPRPSAPVWMITGFKALGVPPEQFETARAYLRTVAPTAERGEALVADMLEDGMMWRPEIGTFGREDDV